MSTEVTGEPVIEHGDTGPAAKKTMQWIPLSIIALVVAAAAYVPSPYVLERPGPVVNALGSITVEDIDIPVVDISEIETFEPTGSINVLSVNIRGNPENRLSWLAAIPGWIDPTQRLIPLETAFPNNIGSEEAEERNAALMDASQLQSTAAALRLLDIPLTSELTIRFVSENGAADGLLQIGDIIRSVDGLGISSVTMLRQHLSQTQPGAEVLLRVERGGELIPVIIVPQRSEGSNQPLLGVEINTEIEFPFNVDIEMDRIGGPSAGLTFAIAQYELLSQEDLLGGKNVSATGTVDVDGKVGAIGGLPQKIWGASRAGSDLVLFPIENCADVPSKLPAGMNLSPIQSLAEAVDVVRSYRDGEKIPGLELCN